MKDFNNIYNSTLIREQRKTGLDSIYIDFQKEFHFRRIVTYISEQRRMHGMMMFEASPLENMYKELLEYDSIPYSTHVSRFGDRLKSAIPEIEKRTINKKNMICFSTLVDDLTKHEISHSSFIKSLKKVITPVRKDMSEISNTFQGKFQPGCQENSVPIKLLSLCSMLIDGCDPRIKGFSQAALSVSQIVMYEYKEYSTTTSTSTCRHLKFRETPLSIHVGLKLYATVRAKTLIQKHFFLGLCISYDRYLLLAPKIRTCGVFVANSLKLQVFTIIAKDNIYLNAKCTKIKQHFHGISMTKCNSPTVENSGVLQGPLYDFGSDHTNPFLQDIFICDLTLLKWCILG